MLLHYYRRVVRFAILLFTVACVLFGYEPNAALAAVRPVSRPPLPSLVLPESTFPASASVQYGPATNAQVVAAIQVHTIDPGTLGRLGGVLQTATWSTGRYTYFLRYSASAFSSADGAIAFRADAQASLMETGQPGTVPGMVVPVYDVHERDGHVDLVALAQQGSVEAEIVVRLQRGAALAPAQYLLHRATAAARILMANYASVIPVSPPSGAVPPVYVAPWGTGPVVKSPSLMSAGPSILGAAALDPGTYRAGQPGLAARANRHAAVVPEDALSRFVRTGLSGGNPLYNGTALYPTVPAAESAYQGLVTANGHKPWLQPVTGTPAVAPDTETSGWSGLGESIVLCRSQNVVFVLVSGGVVPVLQSAMAALVQTVPTWLHAQGTQIVNASGTEVHLAGLNWYGAESPDFVVGGLDYQPYTSILDTIKAAGYNTIRLPFSNQLVEQNPVITQHLGANLDLSGLHALDILDRIIGYAGAIGLSVVLDDHRSESGWSAEQNGLWYTSDYPDAAFQQDWVTMAQRYAVNNVVIGADLRNEPHATAQWGGGDPSTDWLAAAERAGNDVLRVNPHVLIMVEGVQFYGSPDSYWWGGNLMGVETDPAQLQFADGSSARSQLVYSPHEYGPNMCGTGCPWFNSTTTPAALQSVWDQHWGYITDNPTAPYAAPIWLGEFGTCNFDPSCGQDSTPGSQGQWFSSLVQYIRQKDVGWAYWSVNGSQSSGPTREYGAPEFYGLLVPNWSAPNTWLAQELSAILNPVGAE